MFKATVVGAVAASALSAADHDRARLAEVERINSMEGVTWKAAMPEKFKGQPLGASVPLLGVKAKNYEDIQKDIATGKVIRVDASPGFIAPDSFDSEANWPACADVIGDIRDQSNCGCCWAFGGASAASDRLCIATGGKIKVPLSAQDVCFGASDNGCGGGFLGATWDYVNQGVVTGGNYNSTGPLGGGWCAGFSLPHCHHHGPQGDDPYPAEGAPGCPSASSPPATTKCDAGAKAPHDDFSKDKYNFQGRTASFSSVAAIQEAIMTNGPVESAFTVYSDFENYAGGVYSATSFKQLGGHAIRMVGWGVDNGTPYWKVANSWNPYWGEKGYFRIKRGEGACGMESQAMANSGSATWHGPGL